MQEIEQIREFYKVYGNDRIKLIATNDAKALREEVIPILIDEIKNRGLDNSLIDWIRAERRKLSKSELINLKKIIINSTCSYCNKNSDLRGYKYTTKIGFFIGSINSISEIILCESCGKNKRLKSTIVTCLLGWWSLGGIITMPFLLINKIKAKFQEERQSDDIIESFILDNIGTITLVNDNEEDVISLLKNFNNLSEVIDES